MPRKPLACRVMGHRWSFSREGRTIHWACARCFEVGGSRAYADDAEAKRYLRHYARAPGPPQGLLAALGGTVDRTHERKR